MSGVFISYRRDDSQGWAARLADDLGERLGPDRVFSDIEIPIGSDFADVLHRAIAACDVLLVVIGPRWAGAMPGTRSRLFDPDDWVRTEIEAALTLGKPLVPVPVGGAALPPPADLPDSLRPLLRLQAAPLSARHWRADVAALADRLRHWLSAAGGTEAGGTSGPPGRDERRAPPPAGETLAAVLREISEQVRREESARRAPPPPSPSPARSRAGGGWAARVLAAVGRRLARMTGVGLLLLAAYAGLRLFGDAALQRGLDAAEARAQAAIAQAWRRMTTD